MEHMTHNGFRLAVADPALRIGAVQDVLDLLAEASYPNSIDGLILRKENLPEQFFELKTGFAGEVLQKFSNYRVRLAVIGDFSQYSSRSLRDFIRESNRGQLVFFKDDIDSAVAALSR